MVVEQDYDSSENRHLKKLVLRGSPPSMASPAEFKKEAGPDNIIGCGRPFEESTIPIALLDEAFAVFKANAQSPLP
jgi:hypothetical protein